MSKRAGPEISPFAGCTRLLEQYRQTGAALLAYERHVSLSFMPSNSDLEEFAAGVSFVPVEVLESYLDDLLDLGVNDESLFIRRPKLSLVASALCLGTSILALLLLSGQENVGQVHLPLLFCSVFLCGISCALYFLPRTRILRRFSFATVVSREIASRRGHDKTDMGSFAGRLFIPDFWRVKEVPGTQAASANRDVAVDFGMDPVRIRRAKIVPYFH